MSRLRFVLLFLLSLTLGCGEEAVEGIPICEPGCPGAMRSVERCPAFEECQEVESCGMILLCAPAEEGEGVGEGEPGDGVCEEEPRCPPGSEEVGECPADGICTLVNMCGVSLTCLELPDACAQEPLCPDGDRGVYDLGCEADDPSCYSHYHCSGPLVCLRCEELPDDCPGEMIALDFEECGEEGELCERVETCEETLYCQEPVCEDFLAECPEPTVLWEECPEEEQGCFSVEDQCGDEFFCGAPEEDQEDCRALPSCEEGWLEVEIALCLVDLECELAVECNQVIGCLPE